MNQIVALVEEYASPAITQEVGLRGEELVLEAFARHQFVQHSRHARSYGERIWAHSDHTLDFIFERDGVAYGVEVKNTLPYMEREDFDRTIEICKELDLRCVHVVRRNPEPWLLELRDLGGFTLMLDFQLYPPLLGDLVQRISTGLKLPVDCPRTLWDGTMKRFLDWHERTRGV